MERRRLLLLQGRSLRVGGGLALRRRDVPRGLLGLLRGRGRLGRSLRGLLLGGRGLLWLLRRRLLLLLLLLLWGALRCGGVAGLGRGPRRGLRARLLRLLLRLRLRARHLLLAVRRLGLRVGRLALGRPLRPLRLRVGGPGLAVLGVGPLAPGLALGLLGVGGLLGAGVGGLRLLAVVGRLALLPVSVHLHGGETQGAQRHHTRIPPPSFQRALRGHGVDEGRLAFRYFRATLAGTGGNHGEPERPKRRLSRTPGVSALWERQPRPPPLAPRRRGSEGLKRIHNTPFQIRAPSAANEKRPTDDGRRKDPIQTHSMQHGPT